jgi:chromosome segregation ATPase
MTLEERVARLEADRSRIDQLETRIDNRFDQLETRVDSRIDRLETRVDSKFTALYAIVFGNVAVTILTAVGIIAAVLISR